MAVKRKKDIFKSPFVGIDDIYEYPVLYNDQGDYSVMLEIDNPCLNYNGDAENYYDYRFIYANICKILGAGYCIQKQDVLSKMKWKPENESDDYLIQKHFQHFSGRIYTNLQTRLIITGEANRNKLFGFDEKTF